MVEMAVNFYCTTWAHIPKDSTLQAEHVWRRELEWATVPYWATRFSHQST
jgi:hypothetical protein